MLFHVYWYFFYMKPTMLSIAYSTSCIVYRYIIYETSHVYRYFIYMKPTMFTVDQYFFYMKAPCLTVLHLCKIMKCFQSIKPSYCIINSSTSSLLSLSPKSFSSVSESEMSLSLSVSVSDISLALSSLSSRGTEEEVLP